MTMVSPFPSTTPHYLLLPPSLTMNLRPHRSTMTAHHLPPPPVFEFLSRAAYCRGYTASSSGPSCFRWEMPACIPLIPLKA